jgi:hypothetical protein
LLKNYNERRPPVGTLVAVAIQTKMAVVSRRCSEKKNPLSRESESA